MCMALLMNFSHVNIKCMYCCENICTKLTLIRIVLSQREREREGEKDRQTDRAGKWEAFVIL